LRSVSSIMPSLRVGRVLGVDLAFDASWAFVLLLMTWSLGVVLSRWHAGWPALLSLSVAAAASLFFFASVLVHELAHAFVAAAYGLPIRRITLFLFGGISNVEQAPLAPHAEVTSALIGPLSSLGLGLAFVWPVVATMRATATESSPADPIALAADLDPARTLLLWLGPVNVALALFNLLPAYPLDGGRLLRAALWRVLGDLQRATRWSARVGQAFGWLLVLGGVAIAFGVRVPPFGGSVVAGLWIAFVGWFLAAAATNAHARASLAPSLVDPPVTRLMRSPPAMVRDDLPLSALVRDGFVKTGERAFAVVREGRLAGLVCVEDVRKLPAEAWDRASAADVMTRTHDLVLADAGEPISSAFAKLVRLDVGQLLVVKGGFLIGVLLRRDVERWRAGGTDDASSFAT
jgi:Zn-dependent protease/CBS domain-containing protein